MDFKVKDLKFAITFKQEKAANLENLVGLHMSRVKHLVWQVEEDFNNNK
jgi:hypothetical protein